MSDGVNRGQKLWGKGWRKVKLGEVAKVRGGGTPSTTEPKYWKGDIPWLTPAEVAGLQSRFVEKTERYITKEGLQNSAAQLMPANSILLTSRATIGEAVINKVPMTTNQGFINIEPSGIDPTFLFYWLSKSKRYLNQIAVGSTFAELSKSVFREIEVKVPEDPGEQRRIAEVLSTFDDKIELNNKISRTLEEIAQAIFKEWFVKFRFPRLRPDFAKATAGRQGYGGQAGHEKAEFVDSELGKIPKGWEAAKLSDLVETQYGYTQSAREQKIGPHFLRVKDINKANWVSWDDVPYCEISGEDSGKYRLRKGDVVVARMADPGKVAIIDEDIDAVFASYLIRLKVTSDRIRPYFLYYFLRSPIYQNFVFGAGVGTTRRSANARVLTDVSLVLPPEHIVLEFEKAASALRERLQVTVKENEKLAKTRDLLLPKLMSGEVRV